MQPGQPDESQDEREQQGPEQASAEGAWAAGETVFARRKISTATIRAAVRRNIRQLVGIAVREYCHTRSVRRKAVMAIHATR